MFNTFKVWLRYRDCTNIELMQMLDLSIKAGRRVTHDLDHCISELPANSYFKSRFKDRVGMWRDIFYPLGGMKDYRSEMHREQARLESEIERLHRLCKANGIEPANPDELPF